MVVNFLFYFDICIKFTLSTNIKDEEINTSHLMCVITSFIIKMSQLSVTITFYDKNIMFESKKNPITEKPW